MVMKGMTWASLKKNPSLIPLYGFLILGMGGAAFYTLRIAIKSPEVMWVRQSNPEPWEEYRHKQYKFYSPKTDYQKYENDHPAPKY